MLKIGLALIGLIISQQVAYALNVYEQADVKSKVVFTAKAGETLIPIITKDSWLKVANPKDGSVGWTQLAELKKQPGHYQQRILTQSVNGQQPKEYRIVEYSASEQLKPEQLEQLLAQMQKNQAQMDIFMQTMMQNMLDNVKTLQQQFSSMPWHDELPIIIVPAQATTVAKQTTEPEQAEKEPTQKPSSVLTKLKEKFTKS